MAVDKELRQLQEAQRERERQSVPRAPLPSEFLEMMDKTELKNVILELFEQQRELNARLAEKDRIAAEKDSLIASLSEKLDTLIAYQKEVKVDLEAWLAKERQWLAKERQWDKERKALLKSNADLKDTVKVMKKERFKGTSQKGCAGRKDNDRNGGGNSPSYPEADLMEYKEGFDGSDPDGSIAAAAGAALSPDADVCGQKQDSPKKKRLYRRGLTYRRMSADVSHTHTSVLDKLPQGAQFIKFRTAYSYEQKVELVEHRYQIVVFKLDGRIHEAYLPNDGEPEYMDRVPGTKGSAEFMAYLTYDRFHLHTPLYREIQRLLDEGMSVCRQTLANWLYRVSLPAARIVEHLLESALSEDAVVNVDETWVRVLDEKDNTYRKKYTWCLVNKHERIVIYHYDNGSRGRQVLKELIGDHHIKALQSDGYNVYVYLDNELVDIEHLCCLAHARAKFKYAADQGDGEARWFLARIGELYSLERKYREMGLGPEAIRSARNNGKTAQILGDMYSRLEALRQDGHPPRGELTDKALNYLFSFWKQLTAWRKDGRYDIDNTLAERYIRPLSGERKNSLFFGSQKMAVVSATFHTLLATCHARGISRLKYLKSLFHSLVKRRTDYGNLVPGLLQ